MTDENEPVYLIDALRAEMAVLDDDAERTGDESADASEDRATDYRAAAGGGPGHPIVLFGTVPEQDAVVEAVTTEVDFLLSRTRPLTDGEHAHLLAGADRGVQLAAQLHPDLEVALDDFQRIIDATRPEQPEDAALASFESLVDRMRDAQPVSYRDYAADMVATWVRELGVPWATVLGVLAPDSDDVASASVAPQPVGALRSVESEWTAYAHAVIALVNADLDR